MAIYLYNNKCNVINRKYDNVGEKLVILKYKNIQVKKTITEHSIIFFILLQVHHFGS